MNGVAEGTLISLGNHRALPIEMLYDQLHNNIHSYVNPNEYNIIPIDNDEDFKLYINGLQIYPVEQLIYKDIKECVELTMSDGRKLVCTGDQKVLTIDGWKKVNNLIVNNNELYIGIDLPTFMSNKKDLIEEENWSYTIDEYVFKTNNSKEISKSLAFVRFLGYLLSDGTLTRKGETNSYKITFYMGSLIDAYTMTQDINLIFITNVRYVYCKGTYRIAINAKISRSISKINGVPYGARVYKESHIPEFILSAPRLLIAHFFAGLFGGDGCCPSSRYKTRFELRHTVDFLFSKVETLSKNSSDYKKEIIQLLTKLNIEALEYNPILKPIKSDGLIKYTYFINISPKSVNKYANTIGFSHCMSKSTRLFASYALINLDNHIKIQNMKIVNLFDKNTNYLQAQIQADARNLIGSYRGRFIIKNIKMSTQNGYDKAILDYSNNNIVIGKMIIKHAVTDILSGVIQKQTSKSNYEVLLKEWHAYHWFRNEEHDNNKDAKRGASGQKLSKDIYATSQHQLTIPCMQMKVLSIKSVGLKPVYNLIVPDTHNFVANGIIVHDDIKIQYMNITL